ncbi:MBL fold metallo-hydrolase [Nocardioides sp. Bht2]|uniref:MBL fold metallo-hydrolase n=1 Tax=Nocardioides sp. Bht2 TaxID=3392297 RepID=UPI0039B46252
MPELAFTWWGHASGVLELGDTRIALDPVFSRQLYHLRRRIELPAELRTPQADLVLISHLHADHLHLPSLRRFAPTTRLIVPRGAAPLFASMPNPLTEVVPGELVHHGDLRIEVLPAHHDDRRLPGSKLRAPALGFRIADPVHSVWYPGDTGLFDGLADVAAVDLAIVPIGGWGPTLGEHHLDPSQAAEAIRRVGAEWAVPVHYGTLWPIGLEVARRTRQRLFVEPADRFTEEMRTVLPAVRLDVPAPGSRLHPS